MGLSTFYGSDEERFKVFDRAIDLGSTYFDSADIYGDDEDLLGKIFDDCSVIRNSHSDQEYSIENPCA